MLFARAGVVPLALPTEDEPLVLGTTEDITREKAIEAALRDSEDAAAPRGRSRRTSDLGAGPAAQRCSGSMRARRN